MEDKNHSIAKLLSSSPILCEIVKKVEELTKLNQVMQAIMAELDPKLSKHCRVLSYEAGILTLSTHSPAWGHTLRFSSTELLSKLRAYPQWCGLKSIRTRVIPEEINANNEKLFIQQNPELHTTSNLPKISQKEAQILRIAAKSVTSSSLRDALLKLAERAE